MLCNLRLAGFIVLVASNLSGCDNPLKALVPEDATKYATKMAAHIQDRPECQKFKDEIMSHAKGSPTAGTTTGPIVAAKEKANAAGCSK